MINAVIVAYPNITPVTKRRIFFEVYVVTNWTNPSTAIGRHRIKSVIACGTIRITLRIIPMIYPIIMPVHLAHTGN